MYKYQNTYWPQSNPYFSAYRKLASPAASSPSEHAGSAARTDMQILQDIRDELEMEPTVRAAAIDVQVRDGAVTLSGVVDDEGERWLIESAARRIAGVRTISVQLKVFAPDITPADDDIAHDCERVLRRLTPKTDYAIGVMVSKGWVTLSGDVAEGYERRLAETEVSSLLSVHGVNSQVRVRSSIAREDAETNCAPSVPEKPALKSGSYDFSGDNDRITWADAMQSWSYHRAVLDAAWSSSRAKRMIDAMRSA